jgi:hypothetical protein
VRRDLRQLLDDQHGVLTRAQALASGLTRSAIAARLASGRWQRVRPGVYATFSGPLARESILWAALLRAGSGAVLSHESAAELAGLREPSETIHVTVPGNRTPTHIPGVVVHRCTRIDQRRHPTRTPPQTRVEETVLDLTQSSRDEAEAIAWLTRAVGSRLTTADRLAAALRRRPKVRSRAMLMAALSDVHGGSHSPAELAYLRRVERAHHLPRSRRQVRRAERGPSRYDDVRYLRYRTRVELDGRAAHPDHERWRDMRRDNDAVVAGDRVLRYGFADLRAAPCHIAAQVASVLQAGGWRGRPRACDRPDCVFA